MGNTQKSVTMFLLLSGILFPSTAKIFETLISIAQLNLNNGWLFMDRMAFDEGASVIKFSVKIETEIRGQEQSLPVEFAIVSDEMWEQ
jgi:hypothetical protein